MFLEIRSSRKCNLFVECLYGRDGANVSHDAIKAIKAKVRAEGTGAGSTWWVRKVQVYRERTGNDVTYIKALRHGLICDSRG